MAGGGAGRRPRISVAFRAARRDPLVHYADLARLLFLFVISIVVHNGALYSHAVGIAKKGS